MNTKAFIQRTAQRGLVLKQLNVSSFREFIKIIDSYLYLSQMRGWTSRS